MKVLRIDLEKCDGTQACMTECARAVFKSEDVAHSSIVVRREDGQTVAILCDQCGECIPVCPTQALYRSKSGTVMLKKDLCTGCFICIGFCTKAAMFRVSKGTVPFKCISCGKCVDACPNGALSLEQADHENLPA